MAKAPIIVWFRRDLRLDDHPALSAAAAAGAPVLPVFLHDETCETLGAAPRWRLGESLSALAAQLGRAGSRLVLRRGSALATLGALIAETGARSVYWSRYYAPDHIARDIEVKAALKASGLDAQSFRGALLHEPHEVATGQGRPYAVFTPFWRAIAGRDPGTPLAPVTRLAAPGVWPASDEIGDWQMGAGLMRAAAVLAGHARPGEAAAQARLAHFLDARLAGYASGRDFPGRDATSNLSEHLAWGEISPRRIWTAAQERQALAGGADPGKFLSELGWREFSWHLMAHFPDLAHRAWRREWQEFPWRADNPGAEAWRRGMTGVDFVDAAMRELYVTGRMHNRARMVAASYLTKHLLTDWRAGRAWFEDCLIDWDPAANATGWQWVAGCGPDAAPYFRVFNPALQAERFDPDGAWRRRFLQATGPDAQPDAAAFFRIAPRSWGLSPDGAPAQPLIPHQAGRDRALAAHAAFSARGGQATPAR